MQPTPRIVDDADLGEERAEIRMGDETAGSRHDLVRSFAAKCRATLAVADDPDRGPVAVSRDGRTDRHRSVRKVPRPSECIPDDLGLCG